MRVLSIMLLGSVALAGCSESKVDEATPENNVSVAAASASDEDETVVAISGDSEKGSVALKLPGGFDANIKVPGGVLDDSSFDIDGVGLYPGAKVERLDVTAKKGGNSKEARVNVGFVSPDDASKIADWYQKAFAAKGISVERVGDTLSGVTNDGNNFSLAVETAGSGSKAQVTILDTKDS